VNWFWHPLLICLVVIPATILWIVCLFDVIVRRHDLSVVRRLLYVLLILFLPVIGALTYLFLAMGRGGPGDGGGEYASSTTSIERTRMPGVI
jgi:hypothetical protein